jgi:hypothetical protein
MRRFVALVVSVLFATLSARPAHAERFADEIEDFALEDAIEIVLLPRELQAVDGEGGGRTTTRLEIGERVTWSEAQGRVAIVVTDRRLLAVSTRSGAWQSARFRRGEVPPAGALLGGRVAVAFTNKRAFGFDGGSGNLIETSLGPREAVFDAAAGQNVGVVVTGRRALGLSARAGGFFETPIRVGEEIVSLSAKSGFASVYTTDRILTFRALRGSWEEERPSRR